MIYGPAVKMLLAVGPFIYRKIQNRVMHIV